MGKRVDSFDTMLDELEKKRVRAIPDNTLFAEYKRRYALRTKQLGPYFRNKKPRKCLGCGKKGGSVWMRQHKCSMCWQRRLGYVYDKVKRRWSPPKKSK